MNQHLQPHIQLPNPHYFGGKAGSGTYQQIINFIRPHRCFVEGCAGNASIFRMKDRCDITQLNDLDPAVIENLGQGLLDAGFELLMSRGRSRYFRHPDDCTEVHLHQRDVIEQIGQLQYAEAGPETVLYLDPPYPLGSRKDPWPRYEFEMTDDDHRFLLENAKLLKCDVLISTYPNELYAEALASWHRHVFQSNTRKGKATEWLFMNYDPSTTTDLHDYRFLGNDYRERENYARIERRWTRNYLAMPPLLRKKVLKALKAAEYSTTVGSGAAHGDAVNDAVNYDNNGKHPDYPDGLNSENAKAELAN